MNIHMNIYSYLYINININMNSNLCSIKEPYSYILVTGGLGYIGRHVCAQLLESNYNIIIITRDLTDKESILNVLRNISAHSLIQCIESELDQNSLRKVFCEYKITHVIHLANIKCIADSLSNPLKYYRNNILLLINLLEVMKEYNCKNIIYSSSATVYGSQSYPVTEE
jgi:UDP-glucose 4-epimerase